MRTVVPGVLLMRLGFRVPIDDGDVMGTDAPVAPEALATAATLARWGVALAAANEALHVSALAGVVHGILQQGHLLSAIMEHRGDLYRLAAMTGAATSTTPT